MFDFLKRKKRIMRSFRIDEISAVDNPAQEAAKVSLMKRFNAHGDVTLPAHQELLRRYDDFKRGRHGSSAFSRAWESLTDEQRDQVRAEELQTFERKRSEDPEHDAPGPHEAPYVHHYANNLDDFSKKDTNVTPDFISMTKAINKADGQVSNLTQAEYLAMGRAQYGKAAFDKMMISDPDIFGAVSALHSNDVRAYSAKYHGVPPAYSQADVEPELRKLGPGDGWSTGGVTRASIEPHVLNSLADADIKAAFDREMASAGSFRTSEEILARVEAARRAAQQVANRRGRAGNPQ
jgi:hypothetical protein